MVVWLPVFLRSIWNTAGVCGRALLVGGHQPQREAVRGLIGDALRSDPSAVPRLVSAVWTSAAVVAAAIAPRAVVIAGVKEARNGSLVTRLMRLSRLAVAWLLATGSGRVLVQGRERGAEVVEPVAQAVLPAWPAATAALADGLDAGGDDLHGELQRLRLRRAGRPVGRGEGRLEQGC